MAKITTLAEFITEQQFLKPEATGDLTRLLYDISIAAKIINRETSKAGLVDILEEVGKDNANGRVLVQIDKRYFRPTEVNYLEGDASKAKEKLGWAPKISLESMITEMVQSDIKSID